MPKAQSVVLVLKITETVILAWLRRYLCCSGLFNIGTAIIAANINRRI
jgi:hypothetical protein